MRFLLRRWRGVRLPYAPALGGQSEAEPLNYGATPPNPSQAKRPIAPQLAAERRTAARWRNQLAVIGCHRPSRSQKPGRKIRKLGENASQRARNSPKSATAYWRRPTRRIKIPINRASSPTRIERSRRDRPLPPCDPRSKAAFFPSHPRGNAFRHRKLGSRLRYAHFSGYSRWATFRASVYDKPF